MRDRRVEMKKRCGRAEEEEQARREREEKRRAGKEKGHTMEETSGSSGLGFSIKSYIAMITVCQFILLGILLSRYPI
jgi:hypothetical protein